MNKCSTRHLKKAIKLLGIAVVFGSICVYTYHPIVSWTGRVSLPFLTSLSMPITFLSATFGLLHLMQYFSSLTQEKEKALNLEKRNEQVELEEKPVYILRRNYEKLMNSTGQASPNKTKKFSHLTQTNAYKNLEID